MKTLLLMRHAKSSWDDAGLADQDRPLNGRGERDAPRMGAWLQQQGCVPDHVVCSTAKRARQTAKRVREACGSAAEIEQRAELYHASPAVWWQAVRSFPDAAGCVLAIGHNPELEAWLVELTGAAVRLPTAAIAVLVLSLDHWAEFSLDTTRQLAAVWRPREIDGAS